MLAILLEIWYATVRYEFSRRVYHIWVMRIKDGRMVDSNIPRKIRATRRPVKVVAAPAVQPRCTEPSCHETVSAESDLPVQMVTMDQAIMLNMTQYLTGSNTSAYAEVDWQMSCAM